ncbi:MAG: 50S ribosomal protein L24 [Verrucomicrobia bacterium]|jgi:large subunit ribosomal protein L24|nr:50S ribosomal protein L24 [Verrucomicrobiota bacterium]MBV8532519.1 50S ribosomal protein L24 [Verrucomicrobiota bacterium]
MNKPKFHVKKGDEVEVISGNHRGASGKVLQVLPSKQQVLIEGVRLIKKTRRKSQDNPNGAIITREGPIHISNVKLIETRSAKPAKKNREE